MRLIDANELLGCEFFIEDDDGFQESAVLSEDIHKLPTIDSAPVVHAKWVYKRSFAGENCYVCNRCGRALWNTLDPKKTVERYPYCHCGAKMDEVEV